MDIEARAARLAKLIEDRLDVGGDGLRAKLERAGKRLPRHIRAEAGLVVEALALQGHPRLSRQIDARRLARACRHVERYLLAVDPWDRRIGIVVSWLAGNVLALAAMAGLIAAVIALNGGL